MAATEIRVGVFFDWQNCYRSARDAFGWRTRPGTFGNVKPVALAKMLAARRPPSSECQGVCHGVHIFTGMASSKKDPKTYAANQRQFAAWQKAGGDLVHVNARPLDYSLGTPREKGVDVALAVDVIRHTLVEDTYDVVIIVSADTDLLPALELLTAERPGAVEVATWKGPGWAPQPLAVADVKIWTHRMERDLFERAKDETDYSVKPPRVTKYPQGRRLPPR